MKPVHSNRSRRGFSSVGFMLMLACFGLAGIFWLKAEAIDRDVKARQTAASLASQDSHATKAIEDIKVGDYVLAKDPDDVGPPTPHRVVALPRNWTEHVVHVKVESGGELQATKNHPFWVAGRGWTDASDLHTGDQLISDSGSTSTITALNTEDRIANTYNLTVDGVHTYFVFAGNASVLVHNANTTRLGVVRNSNSAWQSLRDSWDQTGYSDILSKNNRWRIDNGFSPRVDQPWVDAFPGSASDLGETLQMHHVGGYPVEVPLTPQQHFDAHDDNWQNQGGPGCGG